MEENNEEKLTQNDSSMADAGEDIDFKFEPETDADSGALVDFTEKLKKLKEELKVAKKERQEYLDGWQRERADFANYKKDEISRLSMAKKYAKERFVEDLLPVLDAYDIAFSNRDVWEKVDKTWRGGVEYIHQQLLRILSDAGISEVAPSEGEKIDANFHELVESIKTEVKEKDNTVAKLLQKGYKIGERILRPARVNIWNSE